MPPEEHHLAIKNMVCQRCVRVVKEELENLGLEVKVIELGEATVTGNAGSEQIKQVLAKAGFELLEDKKARQVEQIKNFIIQLIQEPEARHLNYSDLIAEHVGKDYHYLSQLFSSSENVTIEKYIILQKIERVKEWLVYDELTLSEMAYKLGYSSVAHLSSQFKQVTGFTPTAFKKLKAHKRKPLDKVGKG
ncbi:AraC family transcriptional regulator [Adhaeribacter sp. BT258]|uniref:AraC family transcriptional regulator n=1 Tax=Adhaeribacter terrigena TaxID=2793070 RepID=A0ABS1C5P1_9BACT|nr:AraC family transcriptional regulator [Adhaeribacter terrigena]MBK0404618.1 AraC family transcriptional regulator [Adhaeribacter terrigena]